MVDSDNSVAAAGRWVGKCLQMSLSLGFMKMDETIVMLHKVSSSVLVN